MPRKIPCAAVIAVTALCVIANTRVRAAETPSNPLFVESSLPFHYPRFDLIKTEHFAPAFAQGLADELKEIDAIANHPAPPTFENTIVALEKAGALRHRAEIIFSSLAGAHTNPELKKIEADMAPKFAAQRDAILLNPTLFARVQTLYEARGALGLDAEASRLLWRYQTDFVRAGARLSDPNKTKLKAINAELATLSTQFSQALLDETNAAGAIIDSRAELAGLSEKEIDAAATAAKAAGQNGKFLLRLQNTSGQPQLESLQNRATREKLLAAALARGSRGGPFDLTATVAHIARLRAERAQLLGYEHHAAFQLEEQTAGSVAVVNRLLADLAVPAVANARREVADEQALVDADHGGFAITAADRAFYAEKLRQSRYAFDEAQLRPYLELNHVLIDGVFYAAEKLYGLTFKERHDLPVYEPTVRVFDVFDADGKPLAIFIGDYYARPSKRGGAWMNAYVSQSKLLGTQSVVANHLNIPLPTAGEPTLLTWDETRTIFHEFGHALHGMFSNVTYPRFSGTRVPRDFVEYPSQVNEMWRTWPEVLKHYAKHYKTGEPMPLALVEKVEAASRFNQGFKTAELLAAMLLDQAWHQLKPGEIPSATAVPAFEATALKKAGADYAVVPPRYRSTYFQHIFSGGYSAGYYSYIWSEVLDADSVEWFKQHGGLTRANGDRFRQVLLSRGGSEDAMTLFKNFTGGELDLKPLLLRRGLAPAGTAPGGL